MTAYAAPVYIATVSDTAGVVAANNYLSVFNPANSGKVCIALIGIVSTYSGGLTATAASLLTYRTTAASGGTQLAAANVPRFATFWPNPKAEVRTGNPSATILTGNVPLSQFPPVISTGAGQSSTSISPPPGASFVMAPGEGLLFRTESGDIDQVWNITYAWQEIDA